MSDPTKLNGHDHQKVTAGNFSDAQAKIAAAKAEQENTALVVRELAKRLNSAVREIEDDPEWNASPRDVMTAIMLFASSQGMNRSGGRASMVACDFTRILRDVEISIEEREQEVESGLAGPQIIV